jgi:hypothetical protein
MIARVGQEAVVDVNAQDPNGDTLKYSTYNQYFTIDQSTGLIKYTADEEELGQHLVMIEVEDGKGGNDNRVMQLSVFMPAANNT